MMNYESKIRHSTETGMNVTVKATEVVKEVKNLISDIQKVAYQQKMYT